MEKLKCEYCGKEFNPARRFVQKFCSTSCRVLFNRHQGSRKEYELKKKALVKTDKTIPNPAHIVIQLFYEQYLEELFSPAVLGKSELMKKMEALEFSQLKPTEKEILGHIRRILQSISQKAKQYPYQEIRIRMKEGVIEQVEKYLRIKK